LANICLRELRQEDVFGRLGGEEFAVCLPDTDLKQAMIAAERIRRAVERMELKTGTGQIHITVSLGVAVKEKERPELTKLLSGADKALYKAKADGRNRVCCAPVKTSLSVPEEMKAVS
jgi:diguanylate cyclase (GGDEF)-like protein